VLKSCHLDRYVELCRVYAGLVHGLPGSTTQLTHIATDGHNKLYQVNLGTDALKRPSRTIATNHDLNVVSMYQCTRFRPNDSSKCLTLLIQRQIYQHWSNNQVDIFIMHLLTEGYDGAVCTIQR